MAWTTELKLKQAELEEKHLLLQNKYDMLLEKNEELWRRIGKIRNNRAHRRLAVSLEKNDGILTTVERISSNEINIVENNILLEAISRAVEGIYFF